MTADTQPIARPRNWLPLPGAVRTPERVDEPQHVDVDDNFSKATIEAFFPRQRYGFLRTDNGISVQFNLDVVKVVGERVDTSCLKAGMRVGYDVGCTALGPRVCTLKIY